MTTVLRLCSGQLATGLFAAFVVVAPLHFASAQEAAKHFVMHEAPKAVTAISFRDEHGQVRTLADFKGKVVLVNLWATWCVPGREEMPALDRLQAALGGPDFEVVPLSIDRAVDAVRKFYAETGVHNVGIFIDTSGQAARALGAVGVPTTLLIDRAGREVGRITGPAEWDAPQLVEFVKPVIAKASDDGQAQSAQGDGDASGSLWHGFLWLKALFNK
jgi:thiol-disulfide isomerase/thioredoxin